MLLPTHFQKYKYSNFEIRSYLPHKVTLDAIGVLSPTKNRELIQRLQHEAFVFKHVGTLPFPLYILQLKEYTCTRCCLWLHYKIINDGTYEFIVLISKILRKIKDAIRQNFHYLHCKYSSMKAIPYSLEIIFTCINFCKTLQYFNGYLRSYFHLCIEEMYNHFHHIHEVKALEMCLLFGYFWHMLIFIAKLGTICYLDGNFWRGKRESWKQFA